MLCSLQHILFGFFVNSFIINKVIRLFRVRKTGNGFHWIHNLNEHEFILVVTLGACGWTVGRLPLVKGGRRPQLRDW